MKTPLSPRRLVGLGLAALGLGAPFAAGPGALALGLATLAGILALRRRDRLPPLSRALAWAVACGAPLVLLTAFTLRLAAPNVVSAGQKAAERMAVASLRTLLWAQDRFMELHGRAGLLAELGGGRPDGLPVPTPLVRPAYRSLQPTATGRAAADGGYLFQIWVIGPDGAAFADGGPLPPAGARAWRACAWPQDRGATALGVICVDQDEDLVESDNRRQGYDGLARPVPPEAPVTAPGARRLVPGVGADGAVWRWWRGKRTRRGKAADATHPLPQPAQAAPPPG